MAYFCILMVLSLEVGFMRLTWAGYSLSEMPEVFFSGSMADRLALQEPLPHKKVQRGEVQANMPADLQVLLEDRTNDYAIYHLRPDYEQEPFVQGSRQQQPASMIKLFVMAKAMEEARQVAEGL